MIPLEEMTHEEFERHTLTLLQKELGAYGMARFLRKFRTGTGDYTRDRRQWLDRLTMDDILKDIGDIESRAELPATQPPQR